jgi:hypothetical protein
MSHVHNEVNVGGLQEASCLEVGGNEKFFGRLLRLIVQQRMDRYVCFISG